MSWADPAPSEPADHRHSEDAVLLSLVSVPEGDPQAATANLFAPVVINHHTCIGAQVILNDQGTYPLRRRLVS